MRKTLIAIASLACLLWLPSLGRAQALPTAEGMGRTQVGAAFSYAIPSFWVPNVSNSDPQYASQAIAGVTGYGNYDIMPHFGVEGDFHCLCLHTSLDRAELTYLVGPRVMLPYGRFIVYGKALAGIRDLYIQENRTTTSSTRPSSSPSPAEPVSATPSAGASTSSTTRRSSSAPSITRTRAGPDSTPPESPPPSSPSAWPIASATSSCRLLRPKV